jgi:hypothetical protein
LSWKSVYDLQVEFTSLRTVFFELEQFVMADKLDLVCVEAPHFVAGFVVDGDRITRAAPILKRLIGKTTGEARAIIEAKGWRAFYVKPADAKKTQE